MDHKLGSALTAGLVGMIALAVTINLASSWLRRRTPVRDLTSDELEERLRRDDVAVIDVRTDWEFRQGQLPGAVAAPLGAVLERLGDIPRDRDVTRICRTGHRSVLAAHTLANHGYARLFHLGSGMNGWKGPVTRDATQSHQAAKDGAYRTRSTRS